MLFKKPVGEWGEGDLEEFIAQKVGEDQVTEYKQAGYAPGEPGLTEQLRDISSIANAFGGHLFFGIEEDGNGVAAKLVGLTDHESVRKRIIDGCLTGIEPRIPGLRTHSIELSSGKSVVVVAIPRSHRAPHMVGKGLFEFWIRHDRRKDRMSVAELAEAFNRTGSIVQDLTTFLNERLLELREIAAGKPMYVLSAAPLLIKEEIVDTADPMIRDILKKSPVILPNGWIKYLSGDYPGTIRPTLYGVQAGTQKSAEIEFFRTGYIEARIWLDEKFRDRGSPLAQPQEADNVLFVYPLLEFLVSFCHIVRKVQEHLGLEDPFVFNLTLINVRGWSLRQYPPGAMGYDSHLETYPRNELKLPPLQVSNVDDPDRVSFDIASRLYQAFGYESVPLFKDGRFCPPNR